MDLEKILSYLKNYKIAIPAAVVVGLLIGWLVIGWGIWPVQWTDAAPVDLHEGYRDDYLRLVIYTSTVSGNYQIAVDAWEALGDKAEETLSFVEAQPEYLTPELLDAFKVIVTGAGMTAGETVPETPVMQSTEVVQEPEERDGPNFLLLMGLCITLLVIAAGVLYFFVIRPKSSDDYDQEVISSRGGYDDEVGFEEDEMRYVTPMKETYEAPFEKEQVTPVAQFMTTYMVGDDLYDDSFSIDAPTGEFLGECGVGISETVGIGEPKRVAALEIWLFDKNDIQTVTKVVMSEHAFDDDKIHMRLESKGEPILAEPGKQVLLETATLQLEARIIDMEYGEGAAPDRSFFKRMTLELAVWPKR